MKKHYETHVEDTDKLISVAGPVLDYKQWYTDYIKLMEEQAQRKYGLYTPEDAFPTLSGDVTRWSFKNLTNEMMSKNPRLEDADHKGRFLTFNNFAWSRMSGCGGFFFRNLQGAIDKTVEYEIDNNKITFHKTLKATNIVYGFTEGVKVGDEINYTIRISGLTDLNKRNPGFTFRNLQSRGLALNVASDGIYTVRGTIDKFSYSFISCSLYNANNIPVGLDLNVTIEEFPHYPGALVFDGVDDYGIWDNFPILTKEKGYTVVVLRQWLSNNNAQCLISDRAGIESSNNAFNFEIRASGTTSTRSFNDIDIHVNYPLTPFSYQTSRSYNGVTTLSSRFEEGSGALIVGALSSTRYYAKAAIWELIILDHDATEEELTKIKNYFVKTYPWLFFDQAWTVTGKTNEDTDRATIVNITGNGNNLVLSNFGFAGNSGYGEYAYNWNTWKINKVDSTKSNVYHNRMEITLPAIGEPSRTQCNFYSPLYEVGTIYDFSFKISGLTGNSTVFVKPGTNGGGAFIAQYNKDGVYHLNYTLTDEAIVGESTQNRIYFFIQNFSDEEMNLTIEQIPDHEGYLVTDGVDDIVASSSFELDKKFTVVGEWKFINNESKRAGIVFPSKLYAYNEKENMLVYINTPITGNTLQNIRSFKTLTSDGKLYDNNWEERVLKVGDTGLIRNTITFGGFIQNSAFTQIAFKNLGIYNNQILSKEDCIKAYIYLQTLKAK